MQAVRRYLSSFMNSDRAVVGLSLAGITVLAWIYLIREADRMTSMAMPQVATWDVSYLGFLFIMWSIMMVAMMVPSVTPMIMMFMRVNRKRQESDRTDLLPVGVFVLGYLIAWFIFSVGVAIGQWALHAMTLVSPMMSSTSTNLAGGLLIAGGAYQWTPLKHACLIHCRTPMSFLVTSWRKGRIGAVIMGLQHGLFCVGCCWVLMGLLFVAGVMNVLWVGAIAAFVFIEKVVPRGDLVGRFVGLPLVGAGGWIIFQSLTS
jgi:predicted metal-binding membrane protein